MATITKPMALDESFNTTETTPRNQADVLAAIEAAIRQGFGQVASAVEYDNTDSGLTADNVQDAIDEVDDTVDGLVDDVTEISSDIESTKTATGNPITLTDAAPINAESLVVELEPKQDLHGQSAPYVGGAGKNKLPMTVDGIKAANTYGTWSGNVYTINGGTVTILTDNDGNVVGIKNSGTFSATSEFYLSDSIYLPDGAYILNGVNAQSTQFVYQLAVSPYSGGGAYYDRGTGVDMTLDGSVRYKAWYRIESGASTYTVYPMIRLATETDPTFAPYSNICPITGYTECNVDDVGNNLYDKSSATTGKYMNLDGTLSDWVSVCYSDYIRVKPNTSYYFSHVLGSTYGLSAICFDGFKNPLNKSIGVTGEGDGNGVVTTPNDCAYIVINAMASNKDIVQITEGSTAPTTYQPYQSTSATIQFGQTVYGGRSNFTEGGTDDEFAEIDLSTLAWNYSSGSQRFYVNIASLGMKPTAQTTPFNAFCTCIKVETWSNVVNNNVDYGIALNPQGTELNVRFISLTDANAFITAMSGQKLVYKKATPTTISTPPTDLKLLKGTNNLTSNGTTINLGYQPDNVVGEVKEKADKINFSEIVKYTISGNTADLIPLVIDGTAHNNIPIVTDITKYRMLCVELVLKPRTEITGIYFSAIAFMDGIYLPSGVSVPVYMPSANFHADVTINPDGNDGFKLSYVAINQSQSTPPDYYSIRVRAFNQY